MELGAVDFVRNVLTADQQSYVNLARDFESQQICQQHAQSKRKSSKTKMPTVVEKRDMALNGIWAESVLHKLLDALCAQHQALEDAYSELEAERNASADSIDDAMLMISRLQKEKFKLEMQHTQYRRETEEIMAHVHETYNSYEDLLAQKNEESQALQWQLQAYRQRFLTYGIYDSEIDEIELPGTHSADVNAQSYVASCTEDCLDYSAVPLEVKRIGSHDSAGFTSQNSDEYEKTWSEVNSSMGSCPGEVSATVGFSNYVQTKLVANGGDGHAKSEFSTCKACERPTISSEACNYPGWSPQLCEAIEGLQKKLSLLSEKKEMNSDLENELRSSGEELQNALTAYINSLRQGSNARQRMPALSESLKAEEEEESDGFVEVHVDTEQIRDLPQKTDPVSKRYEEDGYSSESIGDNGCLEPYRITTSSVDSVIMKINTDPFSERYEEDRVSSVCIGENGSLETYKIRPRPVESVIMTINALEDNSNSIKLGIDAFNVKSLKKFAQSFHKWEEVAKGQKVLKTPSLPVKGLQVASFPKCLLSGIIVGVRAMLSFGGYKRSLHRRNYHLTSCKNVGLSNLLEHEDNQKTCKCEYSTFSILRRTALCGCISSFL